jgi:hypothetical protein
LIAIDACSNPTMAEQLVDEVYVLFQSDTRVQTINDGVEDRADCPRDQSSHDATSSEQRWEEQSRPKTPSPDSQKSLAEYVPDGSQRDPNPKAGIG